MTTTLTPPAEKAPARGFWALRDIPTLVWLLLVVIATIAHRELPEPRWLMIHLLLLGAVTHAILVWSQFFSYALLRSAATVADRRTQSWRLALANGGAALVMVGVPSQIWALTVTGAAALVTGVLWHAVSIVRRMRGSLPGRFGKMLRYYVVAALCLPVGAALGTWLARDAASEGLVLAHAIVNVLGWIGLTVAGTLVTLWPTILRTRADEHAAGGGIRALPVLAAGVVVAAAGAAAELLPILAAGLVTYLTGLAIILVSLARAARQSPPRSFAAMSVGMAVVWWVGCLVWLVIGVVVAAVTGGGIAALAPVFAQIVPYLAAGFAAQVLVGALSYLVPVVLGGGPRPVRIGTAAFDRGAGWRIAVANAGLFVCALPVSSLIRVVASSMYLIAVASFLPLMFVAMRAQRRAKAAGTEHPENVRSRRERTSAAHSPYGLDGNVRDVGGTAGPGRRAAAADDRPQGRRAGQAMGGLLAVVLAVAVCAAIDPLSLGLSGGASASDDDENAPVVTVAVEAADMRFTPNVIEVPAGTRLIIELTNTDPEQVHDLVLATGARSGRLAPGASETIDAGVITGDTEAWCSIIGHRQMGMTLTIVATGAESDAGAHDHGTSDAAHTVPGMIDLTASPAEGFEPYDAVLPPLPPAAGATTHEVTLTVTEQVAEVAPGIRQRLWTFGGTAPGPVLHGRVGDTFVVTLVNDGTIGHSIDFHAGALAPDGPMRTVAPGESLTYTFTATRSGIWMYHCSTMPMSAHIANGMYGAVVIEPAELPEVDRSYVLVQAEYYLGGQDEEVDMDKLLEGRADLVAFNGYAAQYDHAPLPAHVGERVRVWVLDAGPDRASSFHVVGGQFDTVWSEGRYLIDRADDTGSQALALHPAQGGFVELVFPEAGHYPFVSHIMTDAERGAHGIFRVTD